MWDTSITIVFGVAQDGGDPAVEVSPRDIVYSMQADGASNGTGPCQVAQTDLRSAYWSTWKQLAILYNLTNICSASSAEQHQLLFISSRLTDLFSFAVEEHVQKLKLR